MSNNSSFNGVVNGKSYNDVNEFIKAYTEASKEGNVDASATATSATRKVEDKAEDFSALNDLAVELFPIFTSSQAAFDGNDTLQEIKDAEQDILTDFLENPADEDKEAVDKAYRALSSADIQKKLKALTPEDLNKIRNAASNIVPAVTTMISSIDDNITNLAHQREILSSIKRYYTNLSHLATQHKTEEEAYNEFNNLIDDLFGVLGKNLGLPLR